MSTFSQYLHERFPPGPYCILVGAMVVAATAAACDGAERAVALTWRQAAIFVTLMLGFFHLRVFDEHKDFEKDKIAHPDRVLSRGLITLAELRRYGYIAIFLELALGFSTGVEAGVWALSFLIFSVLMRYEFGIGEWLNRHLVIYAVSHNPIVALMMCFVTAATLGEMDFSTPVILFILVATFTSLGFEVGRKLRAPQDERPGQDTYTAALGMGRAVALLALVLLAALGAGRMLLVSTGLRIALDGVAIIAMAGVFQFLFNATSKGAKMAETASTVSALAIYGMVAADVLIRRGVTFT